MPSAYQVFTLLLVAGASVLLPAVVVGGDGQDEIIEIFTSGGGLVRKAFVHIPPKDTRPNTMALVLDIHAMGSNPHQQEKLAGFDALADKEGFMVVRPEGYSGTSRIIDDPLGLTLPLPDGTTFNAGGCCPNACIEKVDDVGFIRDLVQHVSEVFAPNKDFAIDPNRIYATGMSNGAFLSHRLGCELSDVVAAIAPVAGVMTAEREQLAWRSDPYVCTPESVTNAPVPVLQIHAINDELVWYYGIGAGGNFPSVAESTERWRQINGVDGEQGVTSYSSEFGCAQCTSYGSGRSNVTLCTMWCAVFVGHSWPGGTWDDGPVPVGVSYFQATENIWEFFKNHPKT